MRKRVFLTGVEFAFLQGLNVRLKMSFRTIEAILVILSLLDYQLLSFLWRKIYL